MVIVDTCSSRHQRPTPAYTGWRKNRRKPTEIHLSVESGLFRPLEATRIPSPMPTRSLMVRYRVLLIVLIIPARNRFRPTLSPIFIDTAELKMSSTRTCEGPKWNVAAQMQPANSLLSVNNLIRGVQFWLIQSRHSYVGQLSRLD